MLEPEQDIVIVALERDEAYRLMTHHLNLARQAASRERTVQELNARLLPSVTALRMIGAALDRLDRGEISPVTFRSCVASYVNSSEVELNAVLKLQEAAHAGMRAGMGKMGRRTAS